MSEEELDPFGNPIVAGDSAPAATTAHAPGRAGVPLTAPAPPESEAVARVERPRRSFVPLLFTILALTATGLLLWQTDRDARDSPEVIARDLGGHALAERSLVREAHLRRALTAVQGAMRPGEELLSVRLTPTEVATQVRDENGSTRLIEVDPAFAVEQRDWSTDTSSTPLDLAAIDPAVPQRVVRDAVGQAGVDDTHLGHLSLTGSANPRWSLALTDVRLGDQSWTADLAGVAVTRPGELPPARGVTGASLLRAANFARAMDGVAQAGRRLGRLRVAPQRLDADLAGRDGTRSVLVDAARRVERVG